MNSDFSRATFNRLAPLDPPEVVEAKMRRLEEARARDFNSFLESLERKRA